MASKKQSPADVDRSHVTVAGIGASAGGVEALCNFFETIPTDVGIAYVVVVHLDPAHESELAAILSRRTKMPVAEVKDEAGVILKPNNVYVIAPDRRLELKDGKIGAATFPDARSRRTSIDLFFRSLA